MSPFDWQQRSVQNIPAKCDHLISVGVDPQQMTLSETLGRLEQMEAPLKAADPGTVLAPTRPKILQFLTQRLFRGCDRTPPTTYS